MRVESGTLARLLPVTAQLRSRAQPRTLLSLRGQLGTLSFTWSWFRRVGLPPSLPYQPGPQPISMGPTLLLLPASRGPRALFSLGPCPSHSAWSRLPFACPKVPGASLFFSSPPSRPLLCLARSPPTLLCPFSPSAATSAPR